MFEKEKFFCFFEMSLYVVRNLAFTEALNITLRNSDPYFPEQGQNLLFRSYTGKCRPEKTSILKYFAQCNTNGCLVIYCFFFNCFTKQATWFSSVIEIKYSPLHLPSAFTRIWILLFGRDNIYQRFQGKEHLLEILGRNFMVCKKLF